jgi:hypothetical protein
MKLVSKVGPLVLVMMSAVAYAGDGGVIGSGGDGRARPTRRSAHTAPVAPADTAVGDVTLPVPPGMLETTLRVTGQPFVGMWAGGARSADGNMVRPRFLYRKCPRRNGLVELTLCDGWSYGDVNQEIPVNFGFFQLYFSNSLMELEIQRGERRTVALQQIHLPRSTFGVKIFRDLSDPAEQTKVVNEMVGSSLRDDRTIPALPYYRLPEGVVETGSYRACNSIEPTVPTCASTANAVALVHELLGAGDGGAFSGIEGNWITGRRYYVTRGWVTQAETPTVWVLPGTYGAIFRAAPGGEETLMLGIRVEE